MGLEDTFQTTTDEDLRIRENPRECIEFVRISSLDLYSISLIQALRVPLDLAKQGKMAGLRIVGLPRGGVTVILGEGPMKQGRPGLVRMKAR